MTGILREHITDRAAWMGTEVGTKDAFAFALTPRHLAAIDEIMAEVERHRLTPETIERAHFDHPDLNDDLARLYGEVKDRRGIVLLRNLPVDKYGLERIQTVWWGLGTHFGIGQSQSVLGELVGAVADFTDSDPHARAYHNKQELSLHTDLCDMIGMLGIRKSETGGVSSYASVAAIHNRILATRPDLLAPLYRGFHYHRRGEEQPGDAPITPHMVPVLACLEGKVSARYVRAYIDSAMRDMGVDDAELRQALDVFDQAARDVAISFTIERGEATIINNHSVLHARTAFQDPPDPARKRLLYRLWLTRPGFRPVPESFTIYGAGEGIARVEGKTPSYVGIA